MMNSCGVTKVIDGVEYPCDCGDSTAWHDISVPGTGEDGE